MMYVVLIIANSVDPDEMQHYAAFHLGLHCKSVCQSTCLGVSSIQRVNTYNMFASIRKTALWIFS